MRRHDRRPDPITQDEEWDPLAGVAPCLPVVELPPPPLENTRAAAKALARVLARQILSELKGTTS
jgi:hypothetical protein